MAYLQPPLYGRVVWAVWCAIGYGLELRLGPLDKAISPQSVRADIEVQLILASAKSYYEPLFTGIAFYPLEISKHFAVLKDTG
jgi:hypothetical protein